MSHSVFSNVRGLVQPEFVIPEGLVLDQPQQMDGIQLLKRLPDASASLVFFDPQYRSILNKLKYGNEGERQKQRALLPQMTDHSIAEFIGEIERILMPSGHMMMWMDKFLIVGGYGHLFPKIKDSKTSLRIVDMIVWNKLRIGMGYRSRRCSEFLAIFQMPPTRAKNIWQIHDIPDVWPERIDKSHPHAKPIKLMEKLIRAVTNEGDIIVDPAAGGYNVLCAANNTGRHFIGCDVN